MPLRYTTKDIHGVTLPWRLFSANGGDGSLLRTFDRGLWQTLTTLYGLLPPGRADRFGSTALSELAGVGRSTFRSSLRRLEEDLQLIETAGTANQRILYRRPNIISTYESFDPADDLRPISDSF